MVEFARSLSGHDKDRIYIIYKEENDFVYLVDGEIRPFERPKKKNVKHIQRIKMLPDSVMRILESEEYQEVDTKIKKAIKEYVKCQKQM